MSGARHHHPAPDYNRAFAIGIVLNLAFLILETFYGIVADSLALIADAGHNLTDVLSLILAWAASRLANRKPTQRHTYGLQRATILAPLFSAILLLMVMGGMGWEAVVRLRQPVTVESEIMILVASVGVFINAATAMLFARDQKRDLNIKGAYLHMLADAAVSIGVVLAGAVILLSGELWVDPVISLAIVAVILHGSWTLLSDSLLLAMDAVPGSIDLLEVRDYLLSLPGVASLHDLHIWGMSTTEAALTAHLVIPAGEPDDAFLHRIAFELHERFGIGHSTIQVENGNHDPECVLAPDDRA
ncbi:MAG: cation diffusion facilitator family transporter [Methylococcaceae bacterium]|nr:cation diffusion facilitator family transporter [Methylococcaceae bacterium]MCI0734654.1 cation diffusion facilitator family transporter [Methylococcaceae bacterium]